MASIYSRIQTLGSIITDAITAGSTDNIPAKDAPANLIKVATGTYREVCPIIVPNKTCVLGDELRSTVIGPAEGSTDVSDVKYSVETLDRLKNIIGDVITGGTVSATSGNIESQDINLPFADAPEVTVTERLVETMKQRIDFLTGDKSLVSFTDPSGYNIGYLPTYGNARKLIVENKEFFQEQALAYIASNFPGLKYGRTKCKQDIGYIIDAMSYDLTYGGSYQTLTAGLAYYEGTALQVSGSEKSATIATYNYLKSIVADAAQNRVVPTLQNNISQFRGTAGSSAVGTVIENLFDIIIDIIDGGLTARPNITVTNITAGSALDTDSAHGLEVGDSFTPRTTANGFVQNRRYWVITTPSSTQFTVSETFGGSQKTLTQGTVSIVGDIVNFPTATDGVSSTTARITAAETLDAAQESIITTLINSLNGVAYHTDFLVRESNITNDDFEIYVGTNDIVHTYVSGGTVTKANGTVLNITNFVYNESTGVATVTTNADHGLVAGDEVDIEDITVSCYHPDASPSTQTTVYPGPTGTRNGVTKVLYDQTKCLRDTRLILESVFFDFMLDTNFASTVAGYSYLRASASEVYTLNQKTITTDALDTVKDQALLNVGGDTAVQSTIENLMGAIDAVVYGGSYEGNNRATDQRNRDYAVLQLERNRDFIVAELDAYIAATYTSAATDASSANNALTLDDTSWLQRNTAIELDGDFGGLSANTTYYVYDVISTTEILVATTRNATEEITLTNDSGSRTLTLKYEANACRRDTNAYIDALKYDIKYPGNYKSLYAARYYANAVNGSLEEDVYYLRNATGVRDQTIRFGSGDLLPENEFGTSRVSGGVYCGLDPGWGPDDDRTWITERSPYVQGVTTFGTACVGQKIDGDLHNGGNDSIVSNDFTQVISDGIGAWITNNGRAELVSVFSYYAHIAYLAENGGRIRATNGNNSYGDFGSVAEGFDNRETPGKAVVDNRSQFDAQVNSIAIGQGELLKFQFDHAGQDYTEVNYAVTGGGLNFELETDEFRDEAVTEVRMLDLGDDSSGQFGGSGYLTNNNTAQAGTTSSIVLSNTDGETSLAYIGMKIVLTGGTGAGQYGIIDTYNNVSKQATIISEYDGAAGWDTLSPGQAIVAPDNSTSYVIEPALSFSAPQFKATERTLPASVSWKDIVYGETTASLEGVVADVYEGSGQDASFDVIRNGYKYLVSINNAGTGYERLQTLTFNGSTLGGDDTTNDLTITITSVNSVTGQIIEFDFDGFGRSGRYVAVPGSGNTFAHSNDGETWTSGTLPSSGDWRGVTHSLIDDGSSSQKVSRFVAVRHGSSAAAYSDDGLSWVASTLPASANWESVTADRNGRFLAIASDSTTVAISNDGIVWDITGTLNATGFTDVKYGKGRYVAIKSGDTNAVEYSTDNGVTWTQADFNTSATWQAVAYGNNLFVAVANDSNTGQISEDGENWLDVDIGSPDSNDPAGYVNIEYGMGMFMATSTLNGQTGYQSVAESDNGIKWTHNSVPTEDAAGSTQVDGYFAIAHGSPQRTSKWVIVQNDSGNHAVSIETGATTRARVTLISDGSIQFISLTEPGSGYKTPPTMTVTDPNNIFEVPHTVRLASGALATPSFVNRGSDFDSAGAEISTADGFADLFQPGTFVAVRRITQLPQAGSNVVFDSIPGTTFKLVNILTFLGENDGSYTAFYQISPDIPIIDAPPHLDGVTTRLRYSQARLTGHDFLDIGTGNFEETNYPGLPTQSPDASKETVESAGGRVFYTSTDQDGNFRVGDLFSIEQSTGIATLNADAFNISGLQELNLGNVTLGGGSATITEFSTDPFFTADSDNVVPTQRAIRAFIANQIGGGGASLVVNSVTAGDVVISSNQISLLTGNNLLFESGVEFRKTVKGIPLAFNYFLV